MEEVQPVCLNEKEIEIIKKMIETVSVQGTENMKTLITLLDKLNAFKK